MVLGSLQDCMCGRYSLFVQPDDLEERFNGTIDFEYRPRYNAAPGQHLPVIRDDERDSITEYRWGLVPSWAEHPRTDLINARSETVDEKPAFKAAYRTRRCLVPVDGFYEWSETSANKQPYRITRRDEQPFALAGLWETWTEKQTQTSLDAFGGDEGGTQETEPKQLRTFTILTREPNDVVREYHNRMPVILARDEETTWLEGEPVDALEPTPSDVLRGYPVSTAVNSPQNDTPELIKEVEV